jgi:hypothetical protein
MTITTANIEEIRKVDKRRGHRFFPPKSVAAAIPKLHGSEPQEFDDKIIHLHYFIGSCDWYIAEVDPSTGEAFGFANLGDPQCAEWGYIPLDELGTILARNVFPVERNMGWKPIRFGDIAKP